MYAVHICGFLVYGAYSQLRVSGDLLGSFDLPGFYSEIGHRLRLQRKRRGQTQQEIADALGIARASYANIESGRQRVPVDLLWRVAVTLSIPMEKLIPEPLSDPPPTRPEHQPSFIVGGSSYRLDTDLE